MNRGGTKNSHGYTILEVLIVLAVTGLLFVSAALMISGKQNRTNFQVGSHAIAQQIQQIVNETQSGYYPHNSNFECTAADTNVKIADIGGSDQGGNNDCIFVGKTLVFDPNSPESYGIYSLAGRREYNGADVTNAKDAAIAVILTATTTQTTPNNLQYVKGRPLTDPGWNSAAFPVAFLSGFAASSSSSNGANGSQQIELHGYANLSTWPTTPSDVTTHAGNINGEETQVSPYPSYSSGVDLCFNSAGTNQSVVVSISGGLRVTYAIKSGLNCP